jgi:hypothetical protein
VFTVLVAINALKGQSLLNGKFIMIDSSQVNTAYLDAQGDVNETNKVTSYSSRVTLYHVPFSFNTYNTGTNNYFTSNGLASANSYFSPGNFNYRLQFYKEQYTDILRNEAIKKLNANSTYIKLQQTFLNYKDDLKNKAVNAALSKANVTLNAQQITNIKSLLADADSISLTTFSINSIVKDNEYYQQVSEKQALVNQLLERKANGEQIDSNALLQANEQLANLHNRDALLANLNSEIIKIKSDRLLDSLTNAQKKFADSITAVTTDLQSLKGYVQNNFKLSFLQTMFMSLTQLKIGPHSDNNSPSTLHDVMNNGLTSAIGLKNNSQLSMLKGVISAGNPFTDGFYSGSNLLPSNAGGLSYLQSKAGGGNSTLVSAYSFKSVGSYLAQPSFISRSSIVSYGKQFQTNNLNWGFEITKSVNQYDNAQIDGASTRNDYSMVKDMLSLKNLRDQLSYSINVSGGNAEKFMSYEVQYSKNGNQFNTTGNSLFGAGQNKMSFKLGKSLAHKIQVNVRGGYRSYVFNQELNSKQLEFNAGVDIRIIALKKQSFQISYFPTWGYRNWMGIPQPQKYGSQRLIVTHYINKKVAGLPYFSSVVFNYTNNYFPAGIQTQVSMQSYNIVSYQSVFINNVSWFINSSVNISKEQSFHYMMPSSWSANGGGAFNINSLIGLTSSFGYNASGNLFQQLSVKQTISARLKKFVLSLNLDLRKNFIPIQDQWLMYTNSSRLDCSFHYLFQ